MQQFEVQNTKTIPYIMNWLISRLDNKSELNIAQLVEVQKYLDSGINDLDQRNKLNKVFVV